MREARRSDTMKIRIRMRRARAGVRMKSGTLMDASAFYTIGQIWAKLGVFHVFAGLRVCGNVRRRGRAPGRLGPMGGEPSTWVATAAVNQRVNKHRFATKCNLS